jgi:nucleotide-binding universal stress UspA family protein
MTLLAGSTETVVPILPSVFPLLTAVTHDPAAAAAIRLTHILAGECGAIPTVLQVVHDTPEMAGMDTGTMMGAPASSLDWRYRDPQRAELEAQVGGTLGKLPLWRYEVDDGEPAAAIVHHAQQLQAELVVLGLPQHNFLKRAFVRDVVQDVISRTRSAVVAVRPDVFSRPRHILVAIDFGAASLRAAHIACQLVAPGGRVALVHVQPDPDSASHDAPAVARHTYRDHLRRERENDAVASAFAALIAELASKKQVTIMSLIESGSSIEQVKAAAVRMHPDLVALGSRYHGAMDWFFGNSVSTAMIGERQWSLLVVPE